MMHLCHPPCESVIVAIITAHVAIWISSIHFLYCHTDNMSDMVAASVKRGLIKSYICTKCLINLKAKYGEFSLTSI